VAVAVARLHPRLLVSASLAMFAFIFAALVVLESPGLGLGHFFYLPIALIAIVGGPRNGLFAGLAATTLYTIAIVANDNLPTRELLTVSAPVRLVTYVTCGVLVGWFAQRNDDIGRLELLASRDRLTGLPNARAFEAAVERRFSVGKPFAILLGDLDGLRQQNEEGGHGECDLMLVRLAETLGKLLRAEEEVARVGGDAPQQPAHALGLHPRRPLVLGEQRCIIARATRLL
jgi:predicted signal transduction protein with EAL and GGDEF domain